MTRPGFYGSYPDIRPVERKRREDQVVDVVGPICESSDFIARERTLPVVVPGEFLAVMSAGAYGFSMASNYNSRTRAAEVLVRDDRYYVVRTRESREDLIRGESLPEYMKGAARL